MEELSFYDVKARKKFTSSNYRIEERKGRKFAVATSPLSKKADGSPLEAWRVLGRAD